MDHLTHDDLTDSYRDESLLTSQSTPRKRHPKGDTPLPAHLDQSVESEATRSHSHSRSSSDHGPSAAAGEDLDRLMALLDGDQVPVPSTSASTAALGSYVDRVEPTRKLEDDEREREATRQPSSPATPHQAPEDLTLIQSTSNPNETFPTRVVPSTSTPPPTTTHDSAHPATHDWFPSTSSTATSEAGSISPSVRARSTSLRAQSAQSMHSNRQFSHTNDSVDYEALESTILPATVLQGTGQAQLAADTTVGVDATLDQRDPSQPRSRSVLEEMGCSGRTGQEAAGSRYSLGTTPPPRIVNGPSTTTITTLRPPRPPQRQNHSVYLDDHTGQIDPWRSDGNLTFQAPPSSNHRAHQDLGDDSDARIADEALSEFDNIIHNATPHRSRARPPSRLRQDPSPWLPASAHAAGRGQDISEDVEDYTQTTAQFVAPSNHGHRPHDARTGMEGVTQDERSVLVSELREANEYITHLQNDIEAISRIVLELKADRTREQARLEEFRRAQLPLSAQEQAELSVARHLISLLPSFMAAAPPSRSLLPTSVNSLALAVAFTRSIDSLIQNGPQGEVRRDEIVFTQDNVERMLRRVKKWEKVVRSHP
ncbi:BZ3500_MvSof-1268-A1-R1_Chr10-1g02683 [Microbotryum saponariae]|uniref:BZ3500_MvSof-1268-A1-R1_Chr10-1g02683 protein n=1 Tax=Microbotryum saponariae TaxID=289078 RepID=A0A2X0LY06_9BASI|nr:BZ3500_MvSof-1268-A1-R1_Chr10-1g02683 [Microbotryum saponariae]SDA06172.1 BZ3501_MvSof-1269-A2-R1_Chr10-1g02284 [Microbotryum saponariae]